MGKRAMLHNVGITWLEASKWPGSRKSLQVRYKAAACRAVTCATFVLCCDGLPPPLHRIQVVKRLPALKKLDGIPIDVDEREAAKTA